jgi:hypothetical protein
MEDLELYLEQIIEPTIADFTSHPASVRHAFLACVAVCHAVDYLAYPRGPRRLREKFGHESPDFKIADEVGHAFKHVAVGPKKSPRMRAADVIPRHEGGFGGGPFGGTDDYVTLEGHPEIQLLGVVQRAWIFLRGKAKIQDE